MALEVHDGEDEDALKAAFIDDHMITIHDHVTLSRCALHTVLRKAGHALMHHATMHHTSYIIHLVPRTAFIPSILISRQLLS